MEAIIGALCKDKYFLSLDRLMAYTTISVKFEDRPKTAFVTLKGIFMYDRMPVGELMPRQHFKASLIAFSRLKSVENCLSP